MPHYELDETKRQETLDRRELDFADIETGFERDTATIAPSGYPGEARLVAYEYFRTRLHVVVFTVRIGVTRIVSLRRASQPAVNQYG